MKQLTIPSLSFYLYIVICCFVANFARLDAHSQVTITQKLKDQQNLEIFTTLRVIKKMHKDVQDYHDHNLSPEDEENQEQQICMNDIIAVFVEMYQRIVAATVTHYLMIGIPRQQDLKFVIAKIIADETVRIISIIGRQLLRFIFSRSLSVQEKICYCVFVAGVVVIIKLGIDHIFKDSGDKKGNDQSSGNNLLSQYTIPDSIMGDRPSLFSKLDNYRH